MRSLSRVPAVALALALLISSVVAHAMEPLPASAMDEQYNFRIEVLRRNRNQLTLVKVTPPRARQAEAAATAA